MKKNIYTILIIVFLVIVAANHFWQKHQLKEAYRTIHYAEELLGNSIRGNALSVSIEETIKNPTREQFSLLASQWEMTQNNIGALLRLNEDSLEQEDRTYFCANQVGAMLYTYADPDFDPFEESRISDLENLLSEWKEFQRQNIESHNIQLMNGVEDPVHLAKTFESLCENTAIDWP